MIENFDKLKIPNEGMFDLDFQCSKHWYETEEGKKQLLNILNETFWFQPDGTAVRKDDFCPDCKNELLTCVCLRN